MELQGEVAGLQGQTPAGSDSRARAPVLICRAADKDTSRGRRRGAAGRVPPPLSGCVTLGRPCTSLGTPSHP